MIQIKKSLADKTKEDNPKRNFDKAEIGSVIENKEENHPKTGDWGKTKPIIDNQKCLNCGICVDYCPEGAIGIKEINGQKKIVIDYNYCKGCGICAEICPKKAIEMKKYSD
jgi:2-oxoacid:acceptor oxidoreductase delta subunit (pyruvate/2-ketoisovalerate family)